MFVAALRQERTSTPAGKRTFTVPESFDPSPALWDSTMGAEPKLALIPYRIDFLRVFFFEPVPRLRARGRPGRTVAGEGSERRSPELTSREIR